MKSIFSLRAVQYHREKKSFKAICFSLLLFLVTFSSSAQFMTIQGNVRDTSLQMPLQHAVAMTIRFRDSLLVDFTRTNVQGFFKMDSIPIDTYQVVISHPRFGDKEFILLGSDNNRFIELNKFFLPPKSIQLTEVTVFGYADPVYYRGDTLVYTADSFKVKKNAVVEDLLKKLPGIKVDAQGKIYSQGKKVDQVLVDGDEFFGSDPTVATKNLAANSVESIQVYDKKNEKATETTGDETLKVMNLQLKDDAKKGYFGKISAAGGFKDFYESEILLNKFQRKQKISLFALGSNTPRSTFGWNDIYQYGLNNEMNTMTGDDGVMYSYYDNNRQHGIPKTFRSGIYYTDKIGKKTKVSLNYSYNKASINSETSTASQYFLSDTTYKTNKFQNSDQHNENHIANLTINHTIDSLTELEVMLKFKNTSGTQRKIELNNFLTNTDVLSRSTDINNSSNNNNYNWNNSVKLTRNFKKRERKIVANYNIGITHGTESGVLRSDNTYFNNSILPNDSIDQRKTSLSDSRNQYAALTYTEPIGKKIKLEFSYDFSLSVSTQDKKTLDFFNGSYNNENPSLSNNFKSTRTVNRFGAKFIYELKKYTFTLGARVRQVEADNTNIETGKKIAQVTKNVLPYMTYRYKFSDNQSLSLRYTTNSVQPDLKQLQPIPDNSDPNFVIKGNPDLLPTFSHNFVLGFYAFKPISGKSMWSSVNYTMTEDAFANATSYDSLGRTISQTVNVKGNSSFNSNFDYTLPLLSRLLELNPGFGYNFSKNTNFINNEMNLAKYSSTYLSLKIRVHIDTLEFSLGGSYSFNSSSSSLNTASNQSYTSHSYDASFEVELPLKMKIETDATYDVNKQRTQGYNINTIIWNASLSKRFLKNENLILSVEANDLLNQNINTYRDINDNVISDIKTAVIGRYIMMKVIFKMNSNKKKDEEDD